MGSMPTVAALVAQLRAFHGYRTLWLDEQRGQILHAEPEDELEAEGYRYVATLMRPSPEALADALGRVGISLAPPPSAEVSAPGWAAVAPASA